MPEGVEEGIIKGMYRVRSVDAQGPRVQLFGSGAILNSALAAADILAEKFHVASDVWSVTSYTQLRRDAQECHRWNMLHPNEEPRKSYLESVLHGVEGPCIAASDHVRALAEQIAPWCPGGLFALGTDGMGRSDARDSLRRHFEVDSPFFALAALWRLSHCTRFDRSAVANAIQDLGIDPEKASPLYA
jgi:pyruvate dehydrogenase E1 component